MKKIIIALAIGLVLGGAGGFSAGIFVFPFLFPPPPAKEQVSGRAMRAQVAGGQFIHADPSDPVHYGKGLVWLLSGRAPLGKQGRVVHIAEDFKVGPGPRFHVYLSTKADIRSNDDFDPDTSVDLGRLRAFEGSQVYDIPDGLDISIIKSVVIWCKAFNVLVSPATLHPEG